MKILITGATGFIGKYLFRRLTDLNHNVFGISQSGGEIDGFEIVSVDITDVNSLEEFFNGKRFDVVFHLAALVPGKSGSINAEKYFKVNVFGTNNLLTVSEKYRVKKFIYSSSASVYNRKITILPAREECASPENIYGVTKLAAENLCEIFRIENKLKTACLRYSSVFGYGQEPSSVLPIFIKKVIDDEHIVIFGSGTRTQDFIYVKDVVEANIKAAFSKAGGIYNISSGKEISVIELAKTIKKVFWESKSVIKNKREKNEDRSQFVFDIKKAKEELHFVTKYSLEAALKDYKKVMYENRSYC